MPLLGSPKHLACRTVSTPSSSLPPYIQDSVQREVPMFPGVRLSPVPLWWPDKPGLVAPDPFLGEELSFCLLCWRIALGTQLTLGGTVVHEESTEKHPEKGTLGGAVHGGTTRAPSEPQSFSPHGSSLMDRPQAFSGCPHAIKAAAAHGGGCGGGGVSGAGRQQGEACHPEPLLRLLSSFPDPPPALLRPLIRAPQTSKFPP